MNDDLISRQAVIKEIESLDFTMSKCLTKEECYGMNRAKEAVIDCIIDLPKVQQKTGHWFDVGSLACLCSCCGCKSKQESRFCPNCGAKMKGETE